MTTRAAASDRVMVSFLRGGLTLGSMVYLEGTYGELPARMAEWDEETQVKKLGHVYFVKGIQPGFPPASESYLAPSFREQVSPSGDGSAPPSMQVSMPVPGTPDPPAPTAPAESPTTSTESLSPDDPSGFEATLALDDDELRAHLAELPEDRLAEFVRWESARPNPRTTLLGELAGR